MTILDINDNSQWILYIPLKANTNSPLYTIFRIRTDSYLSCHSVSNAKTPVVSRGSVNMPSHLSRGSVNMPPHLSRGSVNMPSHLSRGSVNMPSHLSRGSVNMPSHLQLAMSQHSVQHSTRMETAMGYCIIQAIKVQLYPSDGFILQNALTNPAFYVTECAYDIMFIKNLIQVTCNTNRHFI